MIRVATLNLWHDPHERIARTRAAIAMVDPLGVDVLCVQEAADRDALDELAAGLGMHVGAHIDENAVLARHATTEPLAAALMTDVALSVGSDAGETPLAGTASVAGCRLAPDDGAWGELAGSWALSTHLTWGASSEPRRLAETVLLEKIAAGLVGETGTCANTGYGPHTVILGGDFNAEADQPSLAYLHGRYVLNGTGAYWINTLGTDRNDAMATSVPTDQWAAFVARRLGADPVSMPKRRIDHIVVRGWRHGRAGAPLASWVATPFGQIHPSDHRVVVADLAA